MSVEIAWKQNNLVTDFHLLKLVPVVFGLGLQPFVCNFSRQNICSVPYYSWYLVFLVWAFGLQRLENQSLYHEMLLLQKFSGIGGQVLEHFNFGLRHHGGCQRLSDITLIKVATSMVVILRRQRGITLVHSQCTYIHMCFYIPLSAVQCRIVL